MLRKAPRAYQTSKWASCELGSGFSVWSKGKVPSNMTMSSTPPAHTSTSFPSYPFWSLRLFMSSGDMYTGVLQAAHPSTHDDKPRLLAQHYMQLCRLMLGRTRKKRAHQEDLLAHAHAV